MTKLFTFDEVREMMLDVEAVKTGVIQTRIDAALYDVEPEARELLLNLIPEAAQAAAIYATGKQITETLGIVDMEELEDALKIIPVLMGLELGRELEKRAK